MLHCAPKRQNVVLAGFVRSFGHVDDAGIAQLAGCPCQPPAVVAVRCADKGNLSCGCSGGGGVKHAPRKALGWQAHALGKAAGHGVGAAKHLEGIEAEAVRFILYADVFQTKACRPAPAGSPLGWGNTG